MGETDAEVRLYVVRRKHLGQWLISSEPRFVAACFGLFPGNASRKRNRFRYGAGGRPMGACAAKISESQGDTS
jgi:hypothetical protein